MITIPLKLDIRPYAEGIKSALNIASVFGKQSELLMQMKAPKPDFGKIDIELKNLENEYKKLAAEQHKSAAAQGTVNKSVKEFPDTGKIAGLKQTYTDLSLAISSNIFMFQKAKDVIMQGVDAYGQQQIASEKLLNGLHNLGQDNSLQKLSDQASDLQLVTIFPDEEIMNAQAMLTTFKKTAEEIQILTPRILDLASAYEKTGQGKADLQQIAVQVGKVNEETVGALRRYGVTISDAQIEQLKMLRGIEQTNFLVGILDENFKNTAITIGQTVPGQMQIMKNQVDELNESLGKGMVEQFRESISGVGGDSRSTKVEVDILQRTVELFGRTAVIIFTDMNPIFQLMKLNIKGVSLLIGEVHAGLEVVRGSSENFNSNMDQLQAMLGTSAPGEFFSSLIQHIQDAYNELMSYIGLQESVDNNTAKGGTNEGPQNSVDRRITGSKDGIAGDAKTSTNKGGNKGGSKSKQLNEMEELEAQIKKLQTEIEKYAVKYGENSGIVLKKTDELIKKQKEYQGLIFDFTNKLTSANLMPGTMPGPGDIQQQEVPFSMQANMADAERRKKREQMLSGDDYQFASLAVQSLGSELYDGLSAAWTRSFGEADTLAEKFIQKLSMTIADNFLKMGISSIMNFLFPGSGSIIGTIFGGGSSVAQATGGGLPGLGGGGGFSMGNLINGYTERSASVNNYNSSVSTNTTNTLVPDVRVAGTDLVILFNRANDEINGKKGNQ